MKNSSCDNQSEPYFLSVSATILCENVVTNVDMHGRFARWRKWRACDVGEAKGGLENELWRRWSNGRVGEWVVTKVKRRKGWRISCDVGEVTESLENELWCTYRTLNSYSKWGGEGWLGLLDFWFGKKSWWNSYLTPVVNFGDVWRAQLAKSTLLTSTIVPLGYFQIFKGLFRC